MKMEKPPKNEIFEIEKLVDPTNEKLIKKIQALEEIFSSVKEDIAKHKISPEFLQMYYVYQIDYLENCLKDIIDDSSEFDKIKIIFFSTLNSQVIASVGVPHYTRCWIIP